MLIDRTWRLKYTSDDGDLVRLFYVPALEDAERYDRLTGYFNANALALASRGIEGLVRNGGRMRLVVGCTLDPPEIEVSEQAYERSLLDLAMQVTVPEPGNIIQQLRELDSAEARYHEANLMFANGHLAEALELLEHTSQGDFSQPYFLPGYLLARLGLLRDLAGRWAQAERAYRGVLALEYAPSEAREAAREGLDKLSTAKVEDA